MNPNSDSTNDKSNSDNLKRDSGSHAPLVDRALMGLDLAAEHHLANCPCCQGEREETEQALLRYADFEREQAGRQESFWSDQLVRIRAACPTASRRTSAGVVLVPALALLLVLGLGFGLRRQPAPVPTTAHVENISDHDLLLAVESAVDSGTPYALEPVALMVDEPESAGDLQKDHGLRAKTNKEPNSYAK